MSERAEKTLSADAHEIYARRKGRNVALGLCLGGLVVLIMAVTIVKLGAGVEMKGFDHTYETTPGTAVGQ